MGEPVPGAEVVVEDHMGNALGRGVYNPFSQVHVLLADRRHTLYEAAPFQPTRAVPPTTSPVIVTNAAPHPRLRSLLSFSLSQRLSDPFPVSVRPLRTTHTHTHDSTVCA